MAEREVVLDRVLRVELAQRRRDVAGHRPAGAGIPCEAKTAADADHVRVERDDERGGRDAGPDAEIQLVAPDHPSEKEVQPLAGASP
jgi:hypothetical protein